MQNKTTMQDFQIQHRLGEGSFGQVFKVRRKIDGQIYAMKKIRIKTMKQKDRQNALNEIRILASYNGQYIIGYKQSFYDNGTLCIVMQYAQKGDLLHKINYHLQHHSYYSQQQIWIALIHITYGIKSLHDKRILHRDLKSANIFITKQSYKLGDLNVSKVLKKNYACTQTGTPYYASPQVWNDKPYAIKSDIWSLGCVIYEMAALKPPFLASDLNGLCKRICSGKFQRIPHRYSNDLANIIASMLQVNPSVRPTTEQILSNPSVHRNYKGVIAVQSNNQADYDPLLKTIQVNHRNLRGIQSNLPKANYDNIQKSSRKKSIQKEQRNIKTDRLQRIDSVQKMKRMESKEREECNQKKHRKSIEKIQENKNQEKAIRITKRQNKKSIEIRNQKQIQKPIEQESQLAIKRYLEMKRNHEERQRKRHLQLLEEEKNNLIRKRQRILSACGMANKMPVSRKPTLENDSLDKLVNKEPYSVKAQRKEYGEYKKMPPKPIQNNVSHHYPPRIPLPLLSNNASNLVGLSSHKQVQKQGEKQRSKQNLVRAGERVLANMGMEQRSSSVKKIVYPSWWMQ